MPTAPVKPQIGPELLEQLDVRVGLPALMKLMGHKSIQMDPSVSEGRPARLATRVLPGTPQHTSTLQPSLALRLYGYP